jgi:hypothetical protein
MKRKMKMLALVGALSLLSHTANAIVLDRAEKQDCLIKSCWLTTALMEQESPQSSSSRPNGLALAPT